MRHTRVLVLLAFALIVSQNAFAAYFHTQFSTTENGYYSYTVGGQGLHEWYTNPGEFHGANYGSGSVGLDLQGNIVFGSVYWGGTSDVDYYGGEKDLEYGDANVYFNGNAITGIQSPEATGGDYGVAYHSNITQYLQNGNHAYSISDVGFSGINYGFGVVGVTEGAPNARYGSVQVITMQDRTYCRHGTTPEKYWDDYDNDGYKTELYGFSVDPVDYDRTIEITAMFAGGEGDVREDRNSYFWYATGAGAIPDNLVDQSFAQKLPGDNFLLAEYGPEWDILNATFTLGAGESYFAFQAESAWDEPNSTKPKGQSFHLYNALMFMEDKEPETPTVPEPATLFLFGAGVLGLFGFNRRRKK